MRAITGTRYARRASGFQRVTFLKDGRVRLAVLVVDRNGKATEDFSMFLDTQGLPPVPLSTEAELPPAGTDTTRLNRGSPQPPATPQPSAPGAPATPPPGTP